MDCAREASWRQKMLFMDGVRYLPHTYRKEKELEDIVTEHHKDIFGEKSIYFPIKKQIKSKAGAKSVPDAYLIDLERECFHFVEIELASHPEYDHISKQIGRFLSALKNFQTRQKIASLMKDYVMKDVVREKFVKDNIGTSDLYQYFLERILEKVSEQEYETIVVIDENTDRIREACGILKTEPKIIELRTFERENAGMDVHVHLFEPLFDIISARRPPAKPRKRKSKIDAAPQKAFEFWILSALMEMEGRGKVKHILDEIEKKWKPLLSKADYERTKSGTIRWRNRAMWMRLNMVKTGLLRSDSPRGVWEITDKGIHHYERRYGKGRKQSVNNQKEDAVQVTL